MARWVDLAIPRRKRPKLTKADQERFLKQKHETDAKIAKLKEAEELRMANSKVYTSTDVIPMLNHHWMVDTTGQMRGAVRPIRIINNCLYLLDEQGKATPASRDLHVILQGTYTIYNPIEKGNWVKIDYDGQTVYGRVENNSGSHVLIRGYEGTWFPIGKCEKISREEANVVRYSKLFDLVGRKPNEFEPGDIVRTPDMGLAKVQKVLANGMITLHGVGNSFMPGQLKIEAFAHNCVEYPKLVVVQPMPFTAPMPQQTVRQTPLNKCNEIVQHDGYAPVAHPHIGKGRGIN